jgi:hypothetical protein
MAATSPPYWFLISVLFSSVRLTSSLAMSLYQVAREIYRDDLAHGEVREGLAQAKVRNLKKSFALGSITGPGFEAEIETERGKGMVRFLLTREGVQLARRKPRAEMLN